MANYVDLDSTIKEYKKVYTAWCHNGKKHGITKRHQRRNATANDYASFCIQKTDPFNIYEECELGRYEDENNPWLHYNRESDTIEICCLYRRKKIDYLLFFETYEPSVPLRAFSTYAKEHHLMVDLAPGKLSSISQGITADVLIIKGMQSDFINAGWQEEYDAYIKARQCEEKVVQEKSRKGCEETRKRVLISMSAIEKAYNSEIMNIMSRYNPYLLSEDHLGYAGSGVFLSSSWDYVLHSQGVMWLHRSGDWEECFMRFSDIGFQSLDTDDQLFAFSMAMFCRKHGINPSEMDIEQIEWDCKIKGASINNPKLIVKEKPVELKSIF